MKQNSSTTGQPGTDGGVSANDKKLQVVSVTEKLGQRNGATRQHHKILHAQINLRSVTGELGSPLDWVLTGDWITDKRGRDTEMQQG